MVAGQRGDLGLAKNFWRKEMDLIPYPKPIQMGDYYADDLQLETRYGLPSKVKFCKR